MTIIVRAVRNQNPFEANPELESIWPEPYKTAAMKAAGSK